MLARNSFGPPLAKLFRPTDDWSLPLRHPVQHTDLL